MFLTITAFVFPLTTMPVEDNEFVDLFIVAGILGIVVGYSAVSVFRKYFRDLDVMKEQLSVISFDRTRSSCCELRHITPSGATLLCDRKIVKESVTIWFGSQEAFEHTVRSQVLEILTRELSEKVFTTTWALSVSSPMMWAFVDLSVSFLSYCCDDVPDGLGMEMPGYFLEGLSLYLLAVPSIAKVLILLCKLTRRRPANVCLEILKNTTALCLAVLPIMLVFACFVLSRPSEARGRHRMVTAGIFVGSILLLSVFWWVLAFGLKSLLKRPGW